MALYIVTVSPEYYSTAWDAKRLSATRPAEIDERGDAITHRTRADAEAAKVALDAADYRLSHGESERPTYRVRLVSSLTSGQRARWLA
jgi:hypothetical protein